jgi:hypothetical protein
VSFLISRVKDETYEDVALGTDLGFRDCWSKMEPSRETFMDYFSEFCFKISSSAIFFSWLKSSSTSREASEGSAAFSGTLG